MFGTEATLIFSGYIWNNNFGKVANDIVSCTYRYKKTTSSTWINGTTTLTPTKSGNSFSYSGKIIGDLGAEGFDVDDSYNVQVLVSDKLTNNNSNPASFILGPGSPAMAIYKNNVAIGQRYDTSDPSKFQVNGETNIKGKIKQQGTSLDAMFVTGTSINSLSSFDDVSSSGQLNRSMLGAVSLDSVWYNLINIRHRNGETDGTNYGMQIRNGLNYTKSKLQLRQQANKTWGDWRTIQEEGITLYSNGSGTNGTITLSETAANFIYIKVFYGDGTNFMSQEISSPNGRTMYCLFSSFTNNRVNFMYQPLKFSGTSVTRPQGYAFNYDSQTPMGADIKVFKILGYR